MPIRHADAPPWALMPGAAVSVRELTHRYPGSEGLLTVLDHLDLRVEPGEIVTITGASGAGKSTLLCLLGALEAPQTGTVEIDGHDLAAASRDELADFRRDAVGFVFQHFGLLDTLTAAENIALACTLAGEGARAGRRRAEELLDAVDLLDRADHVPTRLSGGERQRVAIARALANRPRLVLADEPTGNLDDASTERVVDLLWSLPAEQQCTVVVVTHDRSLAARAQRCFRLDNGQLTDTPA
jgi:predicted ABC-type transport system involved in lysophospholipase L1 biosynthesis ATPase subunit